MHKTLFDLDVQCVDDEILANTFNEIDFWTSRPSTILFALGSHIFATAGKSKIGLFVPTAMSKRKTGNMDKLHATRKTDC